MTGEYQAYRPDVARTFVLPRQALNDAENVLIRLLNDDGWLLHHLGFDMYETNLRKARQAISDAIAVSDRDHRDDPS